MTQYVKMNYSGDFNFSKKLWKCDECCKMDTESHLLWCEKYSNFRQSIDLKNDKDLCQYLHKIVQHRTKMDLKLSQLKNQSAS